MSDKYKSYTITLVMADGKEHQIPFVLPIPDKGEKGDTGERGEKGDRGERGSQGTQGEKGEQGVSVLFFNGNFYDDVDTMLCSTSQFNRQPLLGDLVVTKDGILCEVTGLFAEGTACNIKRLTVIKGEKGDKGDAGSIKFIPVVALPIEQIDESAIYLMPIENADGENRFAEYVYINSKWETLGAVTVNVDHSEYVKFTDYATADKAGVVNGGKPYAFLVTSNGTPSADGLRLDEYNKGSTALFVGKGTLENIKNDFLSVRYRKNLSCTCL